MSERQISSQAEPSKIIQFKPEGPTPIWTHPNFRPEPVKWQVPEDFEGIMQYNPRHDIQDYLDLQNLKSKIPDGQYQNLLAQTDGLKKRNLEKYAGERIVVRQSTVTYQVDRQGLLRNVDYPEPIINRYQRGQKFLAENGSVEVEREKAEVEGLRKVQQILAKNYTAGKDVTIVVASPRSEGCQHGEEEDPQNEPEGASYHDNIFLVYQLKSGEITMTRYHSTHTYEGFQNALSKIDPDYSKPPQNQKPTPKHMLEYPAVTVQSLDKILEELSVDLSPKNAEEELAVVEACTPLILAYIKTLNEDTLNIPRIKLILNAFFNTIDTTVQNIKDEKLNQAKQYIQEHQRSEPRAIPVFKNIELQIQTIGVLPVKQSVRGCPGKQKSFNVQSTPLIQTVAQLINATSVQDFASFGNESGEVEDFPCGGTMPDGTTCTYVVRAYSGTRVCPNCGRSAVCA